jgi:hypothetical protein
MRRSPELSPEKEIGEGFEKGREFSAAMQMHLHRVYEIDTQKNGIFTQILNIFLKQ